MIAGFDASAISAHVAGLTAWALSPTRWSARSIPRVLVPRSGAVTASLAI